MRFLVYGENCRASMTGANSRPSAGRGPCSSLPASALSLVGMPSALVMASLNFPIMDHAFSMVSCTSTSGLACLAAWRVSGKTQNFHEPSPQAFFAAVVAGEGKLLEWGSPDDDE